MAYNNTKGHKLNNINNTLFQMYSRNKARNLFKIFIEKMSNKIHYDFVIFLRFDINNIPNIKLNELNTSKVYVSNVHLPNKLIPDNFIIVPPSIFIEWFNIYDMIKDIINNKQLLDTVINIGQNIDINAEQLIFAKYILHYNNTDNILYFKGGNI